MCMAITSVIWLEMAMGVLVSLRQAVKGGQFNQPLHVGSGSTTIRLDSVLVLYLMCAAFADPLSTYPSHSALLADGHTVWLFVAVG